jgi:hypothetical protein
MLFSKEQFEELEKSGVMCLDDLNINGSDFEIRFNLFNSLPETEQGLAIQWGLSDSVFRDNVFEYLIEQWYDCDVKTYYERFEELNTDVEIEKNNKRFVPQKCIKKEVYALLTGLENNYDYTDSEAIFSKEIKDSKPLYVDIEIRMVAK